MSECVVRMEKPKCCEDCAAEYDCMACGITGTPWYESEEFNPSNGRLPDCPIICQLPEGHGRLVDADAFISTIRPLCEEDKFAACTLETAKRMTVEHINNAPTIVPAERSETEQI